MYDYETEKPKLFTEENQRLFLAIRDHAALLLEKAGAVRMQDAVGGFSGDSWALFACVDRLVELGELIEVTEHLRLCPEQNRVFVRGLSKEEQ
jgi:hypothetical protein